MKGYQEQRGQKMQMVFDPTVNAFVQRVLAHEFLVQNPVAAPERDVKQVLHVVPEVKKKAYAVRSRWNVAAKPLKRAG